MISLNGKACLGNIVLGLLMGTTGCAGLSAFRAPAVNIGHFLGIRAVAGACRRGGCKKPRFGLRLRRGSLMAGRAYPPYGCGCSSGVEHNLAKVGVEGSNPFARSNKIKSLLRGEPHLVPG